MASRKQNPTSRLPDFSRMSDEEIAAFWDSHSTADYWDQMAPVDEPVFLATSPKKAVSIRLPEAMTVRLKQVAREKGIGYQPLIRMWLLEKLAEEGRERAKKNQ